MEGTPPVTLYSKLWFIGMRPQIMLTCLFLSNGERLPTTQEQLLKYNRLFL